MQYLCAISKNDRMISACFQGKPFNITVIQVCPKHYPVWLYSGSDKSIQGGLDLIECLKNDGQRFVTLYRRQWSRPSPRKRNAKRQNGCLEEALQIAVKRREVKSKGEKERYTHLNAEFQRIARRDKKTFLSNQCKEREENNRMRKTRDLFKKIRDIKGTFHAKMGLIKNGEKHLFLPYWLCQSLWLCGSQ